MTPAEEDTFTAFVHERGDALLRYARLLVPRDAEAEDVLQTALLRLTRHWPRGLEAPEAYARRMVLNVVRDRSRRRHLVAVPALARHDAEDPRSDHATDIAADAGIQQVLSVLPPRQRAAVVLRVIEGFSEADAATAMGCSVGTVKSNLSRGLTRLRTVLANSGTITEKVSP